MTVATWRVAVGEECIAAACCIGIAPKRFALGDDGRSHPTSDLVPPDDSVLDAAISCPMEAITIQDAETGTPINP